MALVTEESVEEYFSRILAVVFVAWAWCVAGEPFVAASVADFVLVMFADFVLLFFEKFIELVYVYFGELVLRHVR